MGTIKYYFKDRRARDLDNPLKLLTDGLVAAQIIQDDCCQCPSIEVLVEAKKGR